MMKRIFALASISALGGFTATAIVGGCSSDESKATPPADAGIDARRGKDATPPPSPTEPEEGESCLSTEPIDATKFPYAKALRSPGACTDDELKAISSYFKTKTSADEDVLVSEWSKEVTPNCAKCAFSAADATEWAPILVKDDKLDNVNRGGCIEIMSGKESCGRAYQQVTECRLEACLAKCQTQDEFTECLQAAGAIFTGPCKVSYDAMEQECGNNLASYESACRGTEWTFEGPIKVQCITGGGKADAGDGG